MIGPEGTQARRPLRTAGLALLGLAAAAALIGLLVLRTGNGVTSAGEQPTVTPGPAPGSSSTAPPSSFPAPPPGPSPAPPPSSLPVPPPVTPGPGAVPAAPVPPAPADTDVDASGKGISRGQVRVYNNSTISGLAARAASDLSTAGWTVVEASNYPGGRIPTTTVYYQEGTDQRAIAEAIGAEFGMRVLPRFPGIANARPGVIVIVTNDYRS
ncbi:MAG: LytR C-terminal domain-containing protein [Pseudonocardiaceae bacterium]